MKRSVILGLVLSVLGLFVAPAVHAQINDAIWDVDCVGSASATAVAPTGAQGVGTGPTLLGANLVSVFQVSTTGAATHQWSCNIRCNPSRTASGKGCTIFGIAFYYGVQTTAATSEGAPACQINTMPAPAAGETASTVAGVNIPGTAQPVVGSANLGTVTAGQFFNQWFGFTTPQALNGPFQEIKCQFSLVQSAAAAMVTNSPGATVFGVNNIF